MSKTPASKQPNPNGNVSVTGIEVLRPGAFIDVNGQRVTVDIAAMHEMAETYAPASFSAPLVVGHPRTDDPAYGQITNPRVIGDRLVVDAVEVDPQFADAVNAKRFTSVSLSFYRPGDRGNPRAGKHMIKHVGLLGAVRPAVTGLKSIPAFADGDAAVAVIVPQDQIENPKKEAQLPEDKDTKAEAVALAAERTKLEGDKAALAAEKAAMDTARQEAIKSDAVAFASEQVAAFKVAPHRKDALAHLAVTLCQPEAVAFAQGDKTTSPLQILKDIFADAKPLQMKGAFAKGEGKDVGGEAVSFAAPSGHDVDVGSLAIHARAKALMKDDAKLKYMDAVALAEAQT